MLCSCGKREARQPCGLCKVCYQRDWRKRNRDKMRAYWHKHKHKRENPRGMPKEPPLEIFLRAFEIEPKELAHYIQELRYRNPEPSGYQERDHHFNKLTA